MKYWIQIRLYNQTGPVTLNLDQSMWIESKEQIQFSFNLKLDQTLQTDQDQIYLTKSRLNGLL